MKALLLILICSISVFADGINKPKPKPKRKVHKVEGIKIEGTKPKPVKPPEMLTTKYDELLGHPFLRPLQPLNEIPALPPEAVTTSEVAVYPFEENHRPKLWFLLIGAAIPFLIPHDDDSPTPTTFVAPPTIVPGINPLTGPSPSPTPTPTPDSTPEPRIGPTPGTTEVPEPTSVLLFASGMAMIFRRKIRAAAHRIRGRG